ncbi:tryptophan 7-halogenase [Pseudoalteromonas sp. MMG022]|uniref:NAD(P)/FAD-dependent oxidoreductase n=1 Tax=Pseudoalteromonas sp. MMG022 TaxID=2909978 RepID=UPI001F24D9DA|nr:tryptophan 7-halogenase [Pseudoalteromonas sp. MMG022]MCF6436707.1 tryptophan 7-halogenase [Pseudoalteromonas sp. MMG022]
MRAETNQKTQIAIVGAGIAGCIAALALSKHFQVILLDKHTHPLAKAGECLPPAARRILKLLGIEHLLDNGPHLVSQGMLSYWGSSQPAVVDNLRNPDGLGWHLNRTQFETQLRLQCLRSGVQCIWPAKPITSKFHDNRWFLEYEHKQQTLSLSANVVIDASGRHSVFARQQGVTRKQYDKLVSIWLSAQFSVSKNMALISSSQRGWWYSAPIPSDQFGEAINNAQSRIVSWQLNAEQLQKQDHQDVEQFLQQARMTHGFKTLIEQLIPNTQTLHGLVAANTSKLEQVAGKQWYAIGDTAMSFDPLSSQGMYNAMASAMQLCDMLIHKGLHSRDTACHYQQQMDKVWQHYLHHKSLYYKQAGMTA